jgi:hypothetical protein
MSDSILQSSGIAVGTMTVIGVVYKLFQLINNKRIRSSCNGHNIVDVVIDVREATDEEKNPPKPSIEPGHLDRVSSLDLVARTVSAIDDDAKDARARPSLGI